MKTQWIGGGVVAAALTLASVQVIGQAPATDTGERQSLQQMSPEVVADLLASARPDTPAALTLANREIVILRAAVLGRGASERVAAAERLLDESITDARSYDVSGRTLGGATIVSVDGRDIFAIVPADVDRLLGETLDSKTNLALTRLRQALLEISEARRPAAIAWASFQAVIASVVYGGMLLLLARAYRRANIELEQKAQRRLAQTAVGEELIRATRLMQYLRRLVQVTLVTAWLAVTYVWLTFVLRRFPYTRAWGESLRQVLLDRARLLVEATAGAIPDIFTVILILLLTRIAIQAIRVVFVMAEQGRIELPWVYPETAATTRKLVIGVLGALALIFSYPYLPGSHTEAFKGVSVLVGLMISLGSTGISNQIMSGFTLTYSRSMRRGDFVQVGDVAGTVTHTGLLSTKIETPYREEITIPNAVLVSQVVTNYSRQHATGVYMTTTVTISYDAPWRLVEALLLAAASKTAGLRSDPPPVVRQTALEDFFVRYTLLVCIDKPAQRGPVLTELHAHIQDAFNEQGVQIMAPHYESDPATPKIVPPDRWFPNASLRVGSGQRRPSVVTTNR